MPPAFVLSQDQTLKFNPGPTLDHRPQSITAPGHDCKGQPLILGPLNVRIDARTSERPSSITLVGRRPRIPSLSSQSQTAPRLAAGQSQSAPLRFRPRPKGAALITPHRCPCQPRFSRLDARPGLDPSTRRQSPARNAYISPAKPLVQTPRHIFFTNPTPSQQPQPTQLREHLFRQRLLPDTGAVGRCHLRR